MKLEINLPFDSMKGVAVLCIAIFTLGGLSNAAVRIIIGHEIVPLFSMVNNHIKERERLLDEAAQRRKKETAAFDEMFNAMKKEQHDDMDRIFKQTRADFDRVFGITPEKRAEIQRKIHEGWDDKEGVYKK